ncbi:MAG: hypothetical protein HUU01_21930 [Saprospiraceae bacterium]|nr:hypothetical protein [Saprospiraceae bacterium]
MSFLDFDLIMIADSATISDRCFGGGAKGVLVILTSPPEIREEMEAFAAKVFAAAQIDLHKDATLLYVKPDEQFSLAQLSRQKPVRYVLAFGIPAANMGVQALVQAYQPAGIEGLTLMLAHDIAAIAEERKQGGKQLSGALWNALKLLFKL